MARYFSASETATLDLTLEDAVSENRTWDVFVSHTTGDDALADSVARCIKTYGLSAWVDSDFFDPEDDGPDMAKKIKDVIQRSYCLMAVVTGATKESWWVPFEIGVAFDMSRYLSTYGDPRTKLPSYLRRWPHVTSHEGLHLWCDEVKRRKTDEPPTFADNSVDMSILHRVYYARNMKEMAKRFPGG